MPAALHQILRRLALRLILMLDALLGARAARLRALPARHARAQARALARLERVHATLADPHLFDDPRMIGCAAEVARVRNDPGRRALARRRIYPWLFFALPEPRPVPTASPTHARCTTSP